MVLRVFADQCARRCLLHVLSNITYMSDEREQNPNQGSGHELSFALNFEVNLMNDFELDAEFRPVGCGGDLQKMWWAWRRDKKAQGNLTTINCPANMER